MAGVGRASIALGSGGDVGHAAGAAGFSATGKEGLRKAASTAATGKRQKECSLVQPLLFDGNKKKTTSLA